MARAPGPRPRLGLTAAAAAALLLRSSAGAAAATEAGAASATYGGFGSYEAWQAAKLFERRDLVSTVPGRSARVQH